MKRLFLILFIISGLYATSDTFPPSADRPVIADFLSSPNNTYYCATTGNNSTGDGSIGSPWYDLRGAEGTVNAGDLVLFRGGAYTAVTDGDYNNCSNEMTDDGTSDNPIVISNYPGEIATWDYQGGWLMSLSGDYQKLIGTMVGSSYGIQITGGISIHLADHVQVSNIEFINGTSNGGDLNPAMLSEPNTTYTNDGTIISHNYFHDSNFEIAEQRMVCVLFFDNQNTIIEYNLFEDNPDIYQECVVRFKDVTTDAIVRYNKFINCAGGIGWGVQGDQFEGMDFYGNLSYGCSHFLSFISDLGDADEFNVYNNVALGLTSAFMYYLNADNQNWTEHGDIYDNVIDGTMFEEGWHGNSSDDNNVPDLVDYNLWYASGDRNDPWSVGGYYTHAVTENNAVTYNATSMTATVADDYDGLGAGRYGGNIGGFTFEGGEEPPAQSTGNGSMHPGGQGTIHPGGQGKME